MSYKNSVQKRMSLDLKMKVVLHTFVFHSNQRDILTQRNSFDATSIRLSPWLNLLSAIGVNPSGFFKFLSKFHAHIVRSQLKYGLVINRFTASQLHGLDKAQDIYIRLAHSA